MFVALIQFCTCLYQFQQHIFFEQRNSEDITGSEEYCYWKCITFKYILLVKNKAMYLFYRIKLHIFHSFSSSKLIGINDSPNSSLSSLITSTYKYQPTTPSRGHSSVMGGTYLRSQDVILFAEWWLPFCALYNIKTI